MAEENNVENKEEKKPEGPPPAEEKPAADGEKPASGETPAPPPAAAEPPAPEPPKPTVRKANFEKDVVYLFQFSRTPTVPSMSPYCLKVETWLRLAGLKYENVDHKMKFRSKKGLLPFVEFNGEEINDSATIIKELAVKFDKDLDASLDGAQNTISYATISMIENHLYWVILWWRSKHPESLIKGYKVNLQHALGSRFPLIFLNYIFKFSYSRKSGKKVKAQGIAVHKPEEIIEQGQADLKVLSDLLADKPFFFGDEPKLLDIVAFANLAQIYFIEKDIQFPLQEYMLEHCTNLVGHVNRMKERCFPDWEDITTTLDLNSHLPKPPPEEKEAKGKGDDEEKKKEKEGDKEEKDDKPEKEIEKESKEKEVVENKEKKEDN